MLDTSPNTPLLSVGGSEITSIHWHFGSTCCARHTQVLDLKWVGWYLGSFFFIFLVCAWKMEALPTANWSSAFYLYLSHPPPPHPPRHTHQPHPLGEKALFPRETSVCNNPCCFQSLIGRPTDLTKWWCSKMMWSSPEVGCEQNSISVTSYMFLNL